MTSQLNAKDAELKATKKLLEDERKKTERALKKVSNQDENSPINSPISSDIARLEESGIKAFGHVQASMDRFEYAGDPQTLGQRWHEWAQMFDLYIQTNQMTNSKAIKSSFLYHMGREALKVYGTLK